MVNKGVSKRMRVEQHIDMLKGTHYDALFEKLYGESHVEGNKKRYIDAIHGFEKQFGEGNLGIFSAPGRIEIGGNHTDHNNGKVLTASINLDSIGIAMPTALNEVTIVSPGYDQDFTIHLDDLSCDQDGATIQLVQGLLEGFQTFGHRIGGFNVYVTSNVIPAAGVSSSASFEMLICAIIDHFYNEGKVSKVDYAKIGKYAENNHWNKASGLLDQMASAIGNLVTIDFRDEDHPVVEQVDVDFESSDYGVIVVNTGDGHADLSAEYSAIPEEMKQVAHYFGKQVCADIQLEDILNNIKELREQVSDRAILRAIHFHNENKVVEQQLESLATNDFDRFLSLITASGDSSWTLLQNCYSISNPNVQGVPVALAMTKMFISKIGKGACRVHGGGFAGTILAIIPKAFVKDYETYMEANFMKDAIYPMVIRPYGAINVSSMVALG